MFVRPDVAAAVCKLSASLMLDSCSPSENALTQALSFDVDKLEDLTDAGLSRFIIVLGQYLVSLKYKENELRVEKMEAEKRLLRDSMSLIKQQTWKANTPLKEKMAVVIESNESLHELSLSNDVLDAQLAILDGMYSSFVEYINAYKREQYRRAGRSPRLIDQQ